MDKNRIKGASVGRAGYLSRSPYPSKDAKRRSGNCARKATELTPGGLRRVPGSELREPRGDLTATEKSTEGIVGQTIGKASEALQAERRRNR
jgi:hypothetical protein